MTRHFEALLGWVLVLASLCFGPLAFDIRWYWGPQSVDPILFPKALVAWVSGLVAILYLLAAFPSVTIVGIPAKLSRAPRIVQLGLLAAIAIVLSLFFATNTHPAIGAIGSSDRYDGVAFHVSVLLAMLAMARFVQLREKRAFRVVVVYIATAVVIGLWGVLEAFGVNIWALLGLHSFTSRGPLATIGHSSLLSNYLAVAAAVSAFAGWSGWHARRRPWWHFASFLISAVLAFATSVGGGRAAIIALLALLIGMLSHALIFSPSDARVRRASVSILGIVALVLGLMLSPSGRATTADLERVAEGTDRSWNSRLATMSVALNALADQPIRPYGVTGFAEVSWERATPQQSRQMMSEFVPASRLNEANRVGNAITYTDPATGRPVILRATYDKAHNYILDLWLAFGLLGAGLLVATIIWVLVLLLRSRSPLAFAVGMAGTVYAVLAQAWFPTVNIELPIWALLGVGLGVVFREGVSETT